MPQPSSVRAFVSGVLVANSVPHIASGVAGRCHLTPLQGRESGPTANMVWGLGNAVTGYLLLYSGQAEHRRRWDASLLAFEAGTAFWTAWFAVSERLLRVNHRPEGTR